jgi:DNA polymerase IV
MEETQRKQRIVLHIDLDAYYASIEQRDQPEQHGKPVVVGGSPQSRSVVATCSSDISRQNFRPMRGVLLGRKGCAFWMHGKTLLAEKK